MMHIGEVARTVGVRPSAIRYYESQGLIRPAVRSMNGYRYYRDETIKLLEFVKRAQTLGLALKEIKSVLALSCQDGGRCNQVKALAREHIKEIDQTIEELQQLRAKLQALSKRKARPSEKDQVCPIIEAV